MKNLKNEAKQYNVELINRYSAFCPQVLVDYAEKQYEAKLSEALFSAIEKKIILIAGPSGSGKTTSAQKLASLLSSLGRKASVISMDDFYKHRHRMPIIDGKTNAEVIESLEMLLLISKLSEFSKNGKVLLPRYDFTDGIRHDDCYEINSGKNGVLIIEGLHAINPQLCDNLDGKNIFRLYISPHSGFFMGEKTFHRTDLRFLRRLVRDFYKRSSSAERTFEMWKDVCSCEDLYVRPLGKTADMMLDTTHLYELSVISEVALKVLLTVKEDSEYYQKAQSLISFVKDVTPLSQKIIPSSSLLHEFLP